MTNKILLALLVQYNKLVTIFIVGVCDKSCDFKFVAKFLVSIVKKSPTKRERQI